MAQLPSGALMKRAASGLAVQCARRLSRVYGSRVVLMVGSGDNGGDALYAGASLAARGAVVCALTAGSRLHEEGAAALRAAGGRVRAFTESEEDETDLFGADLIVDGLLGIGGRRSEEHTSELQSRGHLVCRLLLEKKKQVRGA